MNVSSTDLLPPEGRRLETPTRETLLQHYADTERLSRQMLAVEIALTLGALMWGAAGYQRSDGVWPWLAALVAGLGVFRWIPHHYFLNKKRLEDIRADAVFGVHTRASLLALTERVFARLNLPPRAAPVFMTRDKDVNAAAIRCELLPGIRVFNGVFLNRSIIHLLDEPELESVVGHELGHVFPYAPLLSRLYLLHSAFAAGVAFALAAAFPHGAMVLLAPMALLWLLDWLIAFPHLRLSRGIEFLCDDFGARAAGLLPALSAEFKLGAESEARQQILLHMFQALREGRKISAEQLFEDYENAVPFGRSDPASVRAEMEKLAASRKQHAGGLSLGGFINFLGDRDANTDGVRESISEEAGKIEALGRLPAIRADRERLQSGSAAWTHADARQLCGAIEANPQAVLFQLAHEVSDVGTTHPNVSRRMLFLWRAAKEG
jgi:Zn-dependent protease with chaperone function